MKEGLFVHRYIFELVIKLFPQNENADVQQFMDLREPFSQALQDAEITHTCDFSTPHLDPSIVSLRIGLASERQMTAVERDECLQRVYKEFCRFMTEHHADEYRFWPLFATNGGDITQVATKFYPLSHQS